MRFTKALQQWLGVQKGDKLKFILKEGGARVQKVKAQSFAALVGVLPKPARAYSVQEMDHSIAQALADKHKPAHRAVKASGRPLTASAKRGQTTGQ